MTRRERLERLQERRREWADKRADKAAALRSATPDSLRHDWAFITQPGHIPERARMIRRDDKAHEHDAKARELDAKASAGEAALERTIFSDDHDAPEAIKARISEMEAQRERMKRVNAAFKKGGAAAVTAEFGEKEAEAFLRLLRACPWEKRPYPSYALSNLGGNISRLRKRLEEIDRQRVQQAAAEAAPGGVLIHESTEHEYASVRFAEKPDRAIIDAFKAAGFYWGGGAWSGKAANIPPEVREMAKGPTA